MAARVTSMEGSPVVADEVAAIAWEESLGMLRRFILFPGESSCSTSDAKQRKTGRICTDRARPDSRDTESMASTKYQGLDILFSRQQIAERVAEMGAQITHDLEGEKLVMIGVLKGAAPFLADLSRTIEVDATFDFVATSSYGKGLRSSGAVKLIKDLDHSIEGKNVLVVEDILDTGLTLSYLRKIFLQQHPKSLRIATLLDKPSRRIEKIDADYVGFSIPNLFVIGYGMDYAERYRNLPDICVMPPEQQ
jgi:hypoxanthine phosphoribosyltransferase